MSKQTIIHGLSPRKCISGKILSFSDKPTNWGTPTNWGPDTVEEFLNNDKIWKYVSNL